jgi:hypothetical protein
VQAECSSWPDWRDAAAYAPLLDADRSLFAWEWLRRDPEYRAAAEAALPEGARTGQAPSGAERFGLVAFEAPDLTVPEARPMWRSDVYRFVLPVDVRRGVVSAVNTIDVARLRDLARILADGGAEHLLLSDGLRSIRLDGQSGAFTSGPVCLLYAIEGLVTAERPLLTLRRYLALCRTGRFSRSLHPREVRARRWIRMLRAHDGLVAGADQREIAEALLSSSVAKPRWRSRESSVRSQAQRLVRSAQASAAGGYRRLLR